MTIRETITTPPDSRGYSYGSLLTNANDIEADLDINEAEPWASFPSSGQTENATMVERLEAMYCSDMTIMHDLLVCLTSYRPVCVR